MFGTPPAPNSPAGMSCVGHHPPFGARQYSLFWIVPRMPVVRVSASRSSGSKPPMIWNVLDRSFDVRVGVDAEARTCGQADFAGAVRVDEVAVEADFELAEEAFDWPGALSSGLCRFRFVSADLLASRIGRRLRRSLRRCPSFGAQLHPTPVWRSIERNFRRLHEMHSLAWNLSDKRQRLPVERRHAPAQFGNSGARC